MANEHADQRGFKGYDLFSWCLQKMGGGEDNEYFFSDCRGPRRRCDDPGQCRSISCNCLCGLASGQCAVRRHAQRAQISFRNFAEAGRLSQRDGAADDRQMHRWDKPARSRRPFVLAAETEDPPSLVPSLARSGTERSVRHRLGLRKIHHPVSVTQHAAPAEGSRATVTLRNL